MSSPSSNQSPTPPEPEPKKTLKQRFVGLLNFSYFKSIFFILKAGLILFEIGGAISVSFFYSTQPASQYYNFVAVVGIVVACILIALNVFQVTEYFKKVPWNLVELIFDGLWALLMLIAASIVTDHARKFANMDSYAAAAFFGFACVVLYVVDGLFRLFLTIRGNSRQKSNAEATQS